MGISKYNQCENQSNFCLSLFSAIHFAKKMMSRMTQPPPRAKKAMPKNKSLLPTKLDLLKLKDLVPKVEFIARLNHRYWGWL